MARWIIGYTMFVLGIFWVGWDIVGPRMLLWGFGLTCLGCSLVGGFLWWQDERRWRQDTQPTESSDVAPSPHRWSATGAPRSL
jgi:hypothetical protein